MVIYWPKASEKTPINEITSSVLYVQGRARMETFSDNYEQPDSREDMLPKLDRTETTSTSNSGRMTAIIDRLSPKRGKHLCLSAVLRNYRKEEA